MNVAIIGTGTMGKELVQFLSQRKDVNSVFWKGRSNKSINSSFDIVKKNIERLQRRKKITSSEKELYLNKIKTVLSYNEILNMDFYIEAITEDISKKEEVFEELNKVSSINSIICSNTSSLSITQLASLTSNPKNVIGLHFFNPISVMKLVEVIVGVHTSEKTIENTLSFIAKLGKNPVIANEAPGFIVNRMLIPMINEGITILAEGVASAKEIDLAMRYGANHPIGPLALSDLIGNDVVLAIMETLLSETGDPRYRAHPKLRKMVRAKKLGRKTKSGFFDYK